MLRLFAFPILTAVQETWYVDPVAGDDANSGASTVDPIRTLAEMYRRWGRDVAIDAPVSGFVTVNILDDLPASDPIVLPTLGPDTNLLFRGVSTIERTGTISSFTALDRDTNQPLVLNDSGRNWSGELLLRVRVTAGANAGQIAWLGKSLGGNTSARVSGAASIPTPTVNGYTGVQPGVIDGADPYAVESLPAATLGTGAFDRHVASSGVHPGRVFIQDLRLMAAEVGTATEISHSASLLFLGCSFPYGASVVFGNAYFGNCMLLGLSAAQSNVTVGAGLIGSESVVADAASFLEIKHDCLVQGGSVFVIDGGVAHLDGVGVFDATGAAVSVGGDGYVTAAAELVELYGADNGGVGLEVGPGCTARVDSPYIDGDFTVDGSATARAWDEANGVYSSARSCSWANLATSIAGGGLGGNAHNLAKRASVVTL